MPADVRGYLIAAHQAQLAGPGGRAEPDNNVRNTVIGVVVIIVAILLYFLLAQKQDDAAATGSTTPAASGGTTAAGSAAKTVTPTTAPPTTKPPGKILTYDAPVFFENKFDDASIAGVYMYGACHGMCGDNVCTFAPGDANAVQCGGTDDSVRTWKFSKASKSLTPNDVTPVRYGDSLYIALKYGNYTSWLTGGRSGVSNAATDPAGGTAFVLKPSKENAAKAGDPVRDGDLVRISFPTQNSFVTGERSGNHNVSTEPAGASEAITSSSHGTWDWIVHAVS